MVKKRYGYDIDGLLACFTCGVINRAKELGMEDKFPASCEEVKCWDICDEFLEVMKDAWTDENFWLGLPRLHDGDLPTEVTCYITSRPIPTEITEKWLEKHGFPKAEVVTVNHPSEKLAEIKKRKIDIFVDDYYITVQQLRDAGINALLVYANYQRGHEADCKDLPTLRNLGELKNYV